ncbi:hypothetical protein [Mucilaginibacter pedocola]|uniref:Uncharacterized protein n=1 Tax=Mucilaginibacter pedocola TaxID=1792845 RepID=A0A1S9P8T3_9SPHI|nr:hypothetical protein [Mucilaginibacter pedocola]OOQ57355.1 hypothetical protein BC343_14720 [Mucilaginibacter pedocola]
MAAKTKRYFSDLDKKELLSNLKTSRSACIRACAKAPIQSEVYKGVTKFLGDIDAMAECLTGDRKHLHEKPHST